MLVDAGTVQIRCLMQPATVYITIRSLLFSLVPRPRYVDAALLSAHS